MSPPDLERRVAALESDVAELRRVAAAEAVPWWRRVGWARTPEDVVAIEEAARLGRVWRESFRPKEKTSRGPKQPRAKPTTAKVKSKTMVNEAASVTRSQSSHAGAGHGSPLAARPA